MLDLNLIKWDGNGLVPAIAQDAITGEVLMQAYMNREALTLTLETGKAHYYSRSRARLWLKGETSGHFQRVITALADCDYDSILIKVIQIGAACHTGSETCYFNGLKEFENTAGAKILFDDFKVIKERKEIPQEGSYTNYLFDKGQDKICKKIAEEAGEVIIAAKNNDKTELANEIADLYYHTFVLLVNQGMELTDILNVLRERRESARKREYKSSN